VKHAICLGALALALASPARGAETPAKFTPPAGWEAPPPLAAAKAPEKGQKKKKIESPLCCKFDATCCARQTSLDVSFRGRAIKAFDVPFSSLPEAAVKVASKDGPPIEGVPAVKVIDSDGRPFPWKGKLKGDLQLTPPGFLGQIGLDADWGPGPYFDKQDYRGMGAGEIRTGKDTGDNGASLLTGRIEYLALNKGEGGKVIVDQVDGKLAGSNVPVAAYWLHVEAIDAAAGIVHAYRGPYHERHYPGYDKNPEVKPKDNKPKSDIDADEQRVTFILPEVVLGFESLDAKSDGGFFAQSRFSRRWSFTQYLLPYGKGRSNMANFSIDTSEIEKYFPRAKDAEKLDAEFRIVLAVSQTSVEAEPRVRILFVRLTSV